MSKKIRINKLRWLFSMSAGDANADDIRSYPVKWESIEYRLTTLGFSAATIEEAKRRLDAGETTLMLSI